MLGKLREKVDAIPDSKIDTDKVAEIELNLYNHKILTDSDWLTFKTQFEKAFPDYPARVRKVYPTISEAEERLFLFIKLKLKNKESAAILGISPDSIKKTRTRLRKRLDLLDEMGLNTHIDHF